MNPDICNQALEKVGNPYTLINIVSKRVRELSTGSRPLIAETEKMGWADIALTELIMDKLSWEDTEFKNTAPVYTANLRRKHRA
ncbi:MAG: DNA-directed RNA polymerase subunit omega [Limisphaerales bacterium]|nr:DNA-directed RNA polymerase subunit omega [Verrucomicrobiota bacterium]